MGSETECSGRNTTQQKEATEQNDVTQRRGRSDWVGACGCWYGEQSKVRGDEVSGITGTTAVCGKASKVKAERSAADGRVTDASPKPSLRRVEGAPNPTQATET